MSGICGLVRFDGVSVDQSVVRTIAEAADHRAPDGTRYGIDGQAGLAHLALNVTPESLDERQPLSVHDDACRIVADARVDNRDELIARLRGEGYLEDEDPTDTQLILSAYACWGEACARHVVGDFAFAIWDARRGRLFLARDPMGTRPLYYRMEPSRILFASEAKQILAAPGVPRRIFEPAVAAHLASHPGLPEWSFYGGIAQLPRAHALTVDARGDSTWRYWDVDPHGRIAHAEAAEYAGHLRQVLEGAVRCRMRSDKPVGLFLSGGLDSGSVASLAGRVLSEDMDEHPGIRTYSWAFDELAQCDERWISDRIAEHYALPVTHVAADDAWPLKGGLRHGPDRDEPFIGHYHLLHEKTLGAARAHGVRLMLSGRSGDLMVGAGVHGYVDQLRSGSLGALWRSLRADSARGGLPLHHVAVTYLLLPFLRELWPQARYEWPRRLVGRLLRRSGPYAEWIHPAFAARIDLSEIVRESVEPPELGSFARRQRYATIFGYWEARIAVWLERTHARFGMSFADPWGDRRLASFVLAVPQRVVHRGGDYKRLARQAMEGVMPEDARKRAKKILPTPFYERAVRELARETILELMRDSESARRGYVKEKVLQDHYESVRSGGTVADPAFYQALTLEMWLRSYWQ